MYAGLIEKKWKSFNEFYGKGGDLHTFFAPGRINIIGEHLDYNGGMVLPAAISMGIYAVVRYRSDRVVRMRSDGFPDEVSLSVDHEQVFNNKTEWGNYPAGVFNYLRKNGHTLNGADILYFSTLPRGSGLSSSAAIEVLSAYVMAHDSIRTQDDRVKLALLCQRVENEFIGVQCGIMDQFAVAMGRHGHAMILNSDTLDHEYVPFDLGSCKLIIMNTNRPRRLSESKYNERLAECRQALEYLREYREIDSLASAGMDELEAIPDGLIRKRARHVVLENMRVSGSVKMIREGDMEGFGGLLTQSHMSLRNDYEVTGRELDSLVDASLSVSGCMGARMTGAGFGGCAIALVKSDRAELFREVVSQRYREETGFSADFYEAVISNGVSVLDTIKTAG